MVEPDLSDREQIILSVVKFASMILMITVVAIFGTLPLKIRAFKLNKLVLAFTGAFTGGLFNSIALILLLPRASYFFSRHFDDNKLHYPWAYLISVLSFSVIMFIEKVAPDHSDYNIENVDNGIKSTIDQNQLLVNQTVDADSFSQAPDKLDLQNEDAYKKAVSTQVPSKFILQKFKIANKLGYIQIIKESMARDRSNSGMYKKLNTWSPYVLQLALGIQAILEGLALGISQNIPNCIGLSIAISCHKWAEGLTLGYSFRQARVKRKRAAQLIILQSFMTPLGIGTIFLRLGIGWSLSYSSALVKAIIYAIAAGPYVYISCVGILQEEFNISRYKWQKFIVTLLAVAFVCSIWLLEQQILE